MKLEILKFSDSLTDDNKYIIFVELERNDSFPKIFLDMIDTINYVADNKDWNFSTYQMNKPVELSLTNIRKYVRLSKLRDTANVDEKKILLYEQIIRVV